MYILCARCADMCHFSNVVSTRLTLDHPSNHSFPACETTPSMIDSVVCIKLIHINENWQGNVPVYLETITKVTTMTE